MDKGKVSVIVPVFNVEEYLSKCLDSIINQSYYNLEIILIDDGSTDLSSFICDEYCSLDSRVVVVHKTNGGLSDARNTGINLATGEFFCFIDSDDYIDVNMIEELINLLSFHDADIAVCDFLEVSPNMDISKISLNNETIEIISNIEELENLFSKNYLQTVVSWNKLYKKELFNNIRFPVGKLHEDEFTTYKIIFQAKKIVHTKKKMYFYLQRATSITGNTFKIKRLVILEARRNLIQFLEKKNLYKLYVLSVFSYMILIIQFYNLIKDNYENEKRILKNLKKEYRKSYKKYFKTVIISLNIRKQLFIFLNGITPRFYKYYIKFITLKNNINLSGLKSFMFNTIKKILKFIIPYRFRKKVFELKYNINYSRQIKSLRKGRKHSKIILIGTPEHGNLGDHAIAFSEMKFLKYKFYQKKIVEISGNNYRINSCKIKKYITPSDVICITGGGFLGNLWINEEIIVRDIISSFNTNKIIIFPSTIHYNDQTIEERAELEKSKMIYKNHNDLTIFLRDFNSIKTANELVGMHKKNKIIFAPDMALYSDETKNFHKREGVLICFREDKEKILDDNVLCNIISLLKDKAKDFKYSSTVVPYRISIRQREKELEKKYNEFRSSELVITDRLHAMIFSAITSTPCIAFDNLSGKVSGVYSYLKKFPYLRFISNKNDIDNLSKSIDYLFNLRTVEYNREVMINEYEKIFDVINSKSQYDKK